MLRHYFRTAVRNLWRSKGYTLINILGLAIGMATCLMIFLYILHEISYDKFIPNCDNIYRVHINGRFADDFFNVPMTPSGLAPMIKDVLPELEATSRVERRGQYVIAHEDASFYEENIYFVDSSFLDVFSLLMTRGDPNTCLDDPNSIVMTESCARKYFGNENPIGKVVLFSNFKSLKVTGIVKDFPGGSHMRFEMLIPVKVLIAERNQKDYDQDWGSIYLYTYVRFTKTVNQEEMDDKIMMMIKDAFGEEAENFNIEMIPYLMPVRNIHLHSNLMGEMEANSSISYIYTFSAIALFILVIACINFMNLATAQSAKRAREVGLRKVSGATKRQLITQFLGESLLMGMCSAVIALILTEIAFPFFNDLTGLELEFTDYRWAIVGILLALIVVVGIIAGTYPAFVLSGFKPIEAMKGDLFRGFKGVRSRNILVLVQFSVSIVLITGTLLIYMQMRYIQDKDLGFEKENILVIPLRGNEVGQKADALRNEFLSVPEVISVSLTDGIPGRSMSGIGFYPEGGDNTSPWIIYTMEVDEKLVPLMGMTILEGRNFSEEFGTDTAAVIINEALRKRLGWENPLGKKLFQFGQGERDPAYHIIGVAKNYHFKTLHAAIEPSMMRLRSDLPDYIVLRISPGPQSGYLETLREKWEGVETAFPFDYILLDEDLSREYESEQNMSRLFIFFTILAIFIACLGLFGLASFSAQRRTKEIGIRKVLGAPASTLVLNLGKEFTRWVLIANIIAWPVAYWLIDRWLQSFAFSIRLVENLWIFPIAGILALVIALATVMGQAIRAAMMNPVDAVKYE
jgi:putative ABC transport system permease protein